MTTKRPPTLAFNVLGRPAPQGSKVRGKNGGMWESSKALGPWRDSVITAAKRAMDNSDWMGDTQGMYPLAGPLYVAIKFRFLHPASHYRTGRHSHELRPNAPTLPATQATPDIDKLARSTLDALTIARAIGDDSQVSDLVVRMRYCAQQQSPGALVLVESMAGFKPEPFEGEA